MRFYPDMNYLSRWLLVLVVFVGLRTEAKLNVLFIAIDDLNTRLNCYGFEHIHSPNIDKLAKQGVRFDRAYCQYPSCGPSRTSVLTGLRPDTTGMVHNRMAWRELVPDAVTLPQLFRKNGYHVARVGKIYHQANPTHIGTSGPDDPASWDEVVNPRGRDKDEEFLLSNYSPQLAFPDQMGILKAEGTDHEQTDGKVVDETIRLLKENRDRPFFIGVGLYRPHIPYIAPKKYFKHYDIVRTPLPYVPANYQETVPAAALSSTPQWPNFGVTPLEARECILAYDACTSFVDAQVGRLLKALDDLGLREKTVIVFWGDHGYHLGEHGLWRKNSLFEESARAPLIIDAPNTKGAGTACPSPVEFLDMYPTICELAGIKAPTAIEGKSLVPLLADPKAEWNRPAFTQVQFRQTGAIGRGVRTRRWRYVEWGNKGLSGRQLYDQETDPLEMKNLVASSEHRAVISELRELLHENFYRNTKHEN